MITEEDIRREYFTANEAAQRINVNNSRIRQICIRGRFKGALKVGDTWLIPRQAVEDYKKFKTGPKPRTKIDREILTKAFAEAAKWKEVANEPVG